MPAKQRYLLMVSMDVSPEKETLFPLIIKGIVCPCTPCEGLIPVIWEKDKKGDNKNRNITPLNIKQI